MIFLLPPFSLTSLRLKANVVNLVSLHSPGLTPEWILCSGPSLGQSWAALTPNRSTLCPRQAIISLCNAYPVHSQAPMFSYMDKGKLTTLTQLQLRAILSQTLTSMGFNGKDFGFHTFRRSRASLAFSLNVPVQYIKAHGIWSSDAVYSYLNTQQYPTTLTTTMSDFLKSNP